MSSKLLEVWVSITELPTLVEKKSKLTDLNDTPKPMLLPINDVSYHRRLVSFQNNDPTRFQFLRFKNEREAKNNAGH